MIYTLMIMALYLLGREIPLYGIDFTAYDSIRNHTTDLIMQTVGGDRYKASLFALGISPYMFSMLFVQVIVSIRNADGKRQSSPRKITIYTLQLMFVWACIQAFIQTGTTTYLHAVGLEYVISRTVSGIQMVAGAFVILWLATRNGKYGVGGQTILIFVNILDSIVNTVKDAQINEMKIIGAISAIALIITILFENSEYRIPMQRISIHNIYSDKNYTPIKLNPIGMMPVMFSSAFFMLPMYISMGLRELMPDNRDISWIADNMNTTHPLGILVYVITMYVITIAFSFVFISPKNLAENMQKTGDSITGLRAGRKTKRFIAIRVLVISLFSATFMAAFIGIPLALQLEGYISKQVMNLPSILIALASINCNLYRELIAVRDYDAYVPFI